MQRVNARKFVAMVNPNLLNAKDKYQAYNTLYIHTYTHMPLNVKLFKLHISVANRPQSSHLTACACNVPQIVYKRVVALDTHRLLVTALSAGYTATGNNSDHYKHRVKQLHEPT
jgi:hypothetical protein